LPIGYLCLLDQVSTLAKPTPDFAIPTGQNIIFLPSFSPFQPIKFSRYLPQKFSRKLMHLIKFPLPQKRGQLLKGIKNLKVIMCKVLEF